MGAGGILVYAFFFLPSMFIWVTLCFSSSCTLPERMKENELKMFSCLMTIAGVSSYQMGATYIPICESLNQVSMIVAPHQSPIPSITIKQIGLLFLS
ncbi:hypothetical protein GLYMA_09G218250v4 [Glycine max]|nr:hypothetical protein GLYMA_09G218250v4 [Glycine max]